MPSKNGSHNFTTCKLCGVRGHGGQWLRAHLQYCSQRRKNKVEYKRRNEHRERHGTEHAEQ